MTKQVVDVLLIDDDPDICMMVSSILNFAGYKVQQSSIVDRLPQILTGTQPRLILMDMLLSGKDGRDVCKSLKEDQSTHEINIIMMSAHPDAEISCREAGADDFIAKPFDIDYFLDKVKRGLQQ